MTLEPPSGRPLRMLGCLTLSPRLELVVGEALRLAGAIGAEATFLHVGPETDGARSRLTGALRRAGAPEPEGRVLIRPGRAARVILAAARELGAELIFMGAKEDEGLLEGVIGSVARQVARSAPCSVLLFTRAADPERPLGRVVVSVAFDARSARMLAFTLRLARRGGTEGLHVVREFEPRPIGAARVTGVEEADTEEHQRAEVAEERAGLADFLEGFDLTGFAQVSAACIAGRHGTGTARYAAAHRADLLVLPVPVRRISLLDRFFGHPTDAVLEHLPCSVLLFRDISAQPAGTGRTPWRD